MRLAVSNIAWPHESLENVARWLVEAGFTGIEIAPTKIWPQAPDVSTAEVDAFRSDLRAMGLSVSGIQSLLFGNPYLQLFNQECWPELREQLLGMSRIAAGLGSGRVVFGSPKNRIRGTLGFDRACAKAAKFLSTIDHELTKLGIVMTMEPNATQYGADFVITYQESVEFCRHASLESIRPQVDTGSQELAGENVVEALALTPPAHVHVSAPFLCYPERDLRYEQIAERLRDMNYSGWITLEMLSPESLNEFAFRQTIDWVSSVFGSEK